MGTLLVDRLTVLVFGATGLFGELLAQRLATSQHVAVVGIARNRARLDNLHSVSGVATAVVDRDDQDAVARLLDQMKPFAVVDCAGPFQYYGDEPYRFAQQVLEAQSHYIDIADASAFVAGINDLDEPAKEHSRVAISGASSAPAISAAAADTLVKSMRKVISIQTAIVPGNRARRTLSVMKAILGQIGQPYLLMRYGKQQTVYGWGETRKINMALPPAKPLRGRLAALVNTPEGVLFPDRYGAETVATFAGLEIKTFHRVLQFGGRLVRAGLLNSLAPFVGLARWIASGFEHMGSDVGGMQVCVTGVDLQGRVVQRHWDLVAGDGEGPEIPTLPVSVLLDKLQRGSLPSGARPACGEVSLDDLQPWFDNIGAMTVINEEVLQPIFKVALGDSFDELPDAVQSLHNTHGKTVYCGEAESKGPTGISGRLAAALFGFPAVAIDIPVEVTITCDADSELWRRNFSGSVFKSRLLLNKEGTISERFGPFTMRLGLYVRDNCLHFPVSSARLFGFIPVPKILLPKSIAYESVDPQGRFTFDVQLLTPFGARIAHYKGWLTRVSD